MIDRTFQQFAIVQGDTAQQLTDRLNAEIIRLKRKHPEVTFDGLIAHVAYLEREEEPETIAEEYEQVGVKLTCQDCPFFEPTTKADGTEDRRAKWGGCRFAKFERTNRDGRACEKLFRMLNEGEVRLCLAE